MIYELIEKRRGCRLKRRTKRTEDRVDGKEVVQHVMGIWHLYAYKYIQRWRRWRDDGGKGIEKMLH